MGLIAAPRVRFIQRMEKKTSNNHPTDDSDVETCKPQIVKTIDEIKSVPKETKDFNFIEG